MSDDTDTDDDAPTIEQSEGGTMDSNLTSNDDNEIKDGDVDSGYGDDGSFDQDDESDTDDRVQ